MNPEVPILESSQCNVCGGTSPAGATHCTRCGLTLPTPREQELRKAAISSQHSAISHAKWEALT